MTAFHKKIAAVVLMFFILCASSYAPWSVPRAQALASGSIVIDIEQYIKEYILDILAKAFLKRLARQMVNETKEWLRSGDAFRGGEPLFITNFNQYLFDAADVAANDFLAELFGAKTWNALCRPFRLPVGLGLSQSYGRGFGSFRYKARCSITDIVGNLENFYYNFQNGGWQAWVASSRYENNIFGLLTITREESRERERLAARENRYDFETGSGFIASQICVDSITIEIESDVTNKVESTKKICNRTLKETIGSVVKSNLDSEFARDWLGLEIADEFQEIIFAAIDGLLSMAIQGPGGLYRKRPHFNATESRPVYKPFSKNPTSWRCAVDHGGGGASASGGGTNPDGSTTGGSASVNIRIVGFDDCKAGPSGPLPYDIPPDPSIDSPGGSFTQCNDGIDNDGDSLIDLADSDCTNASDPTEGDEPPPPPPPTPPTPPGP
ncbi:MAG: Uncharacterized protein G01um101429_148 [Parcubacteria group bacterium Gr01-1014_29]|nr:MAG: Uncharacterized protein G01um101429_148 [Parcubacteria group bacterium Gr01-1014_29]